MPTPPYSILRSVLVLFSCLLCVELSAQTAAPVHDPAPARTAVPAPATIPAICRSDIHFDPFLDPTKVAALNSAPAADWPRILAAPSGPALTAAQQSAWAACRADKDLGPDTSYALWQSTLAELKHTAVSSRFVVISGDLLAHHFLCKYKALIPDADSASYLTFTLNTAAYVLTTLHTSLPGVPISTALGNNDSGCTDNSLEADNDPFLAGLAPLVADVANIPPSARAEAEHDFAAIGAFNAPLSALPHTRIISFDDLYLASKYSTCGGPTDPTPGARAIAWLKAQLDAARAAQDRVWFVGHIPPGVDLYATARKLTNVCGGAKSTMFLDTNELSDTLTAYSDIVRLALFGHTHNDEMRLLTPEKDGSAGAGVPLKITGSLTPIHGNRPTFTLARVNSATATLVDYTIMMSSEPTVTPITWSREYTYSTTYHQPAFDPSSLTKLIADFQADPGDKQPMSFAYTRQYYPAEAATAIANAAVISSAWQPYACSLSHMSSKSFAACACGK